MNAKKCPFMFFWIFILLAGCIASPSPSSTAAVQTAAPQVTTPVETQPPQPVSAAGKSGSLVIVIPEEPPSFNAAVGDTGYDSMVMELAMLGLTDLDADGNVITELAESLPTQNNGGVVIDEQAGKMDVTWHMRKDVQWADGVPVTADDVIFTIDAVKKPETGGFIPGSDYIDSVEKVDDYTFTVHYNSIYPNYLLQFGGEQVVVWPKHYCNADQGFIAWDCARQPLSNGPYILEEWVTGDHLTFTRNPKYYQAGKPEIEKIIVKVVPDATVRKTMLTNGDADVFMWVPESVAKDLESAPNVKISVSPTSRWVMRLFMNEAAKGTVDPAASPHPILSDVRVRQAIRMAIDVDLISKETFFGYGKPVWTEFFRPPYDHCNIPRPAYDPEKAKVLLEEAGWKDTNGDGIRECRGCKNAKEGDPMKMELITYSEYGEALTLTQQLIAEMLKKIGIDFKLTVTEGSVMWADAASGGIEQNGKYDIDLYDDGYGGVDPTDFLWQYYAADAAQPDAGWNVMRWINDDFNALMGEIYTLDENKRQEVFCQMAKILDEQVPQVLLFSTINADAYVPGRVAGIKTTANDVVTWNVADWTWVK